MPTYITTWTLTAYILTISGQILTKWVWIMVKFHVTNGASPTLTFNSGSAIAIKDGAGNALPAWYLTTTDNYLIVYDGSSIQCTLIVKAPSDTAYWPSWNGNLDAPTKNAVYDQLVVMQTWMVIWKSATIASLPAVAQTITHNLNVTSADVLAWRYSVYIYGQRTSSWRWQTNLMIDTTWTQTHAWTTASTVNIYDFKWQANTVNLIAWYAMTNAVVCIKANR